MPAVPAIPPVGFPVLFNLSEVLVDGLVHSCLQNGGDGLSGRIGQVLAPLA
jgi:hypothetical protein